MSNCVAFHTQVASIMEVLANAAVAEICKLVDDGYAVLRLEVSQSQKENKALKRKLEMMELKFARGVSVRAELNEPTGVLNASIGEDDDFLPEESDFDNPLDVMNDAPEPDDDDDIEDTSEPCLVKEEHLEDCFRNCDPQEEGKIMRDKLVELGADSGEKIAVVEKETSPGKSAEELGDEHGSRCSVWEVSGLETALKAEPDKESVNQRPQLTGTDHRAERVTSLGSDYAICEMPVQSKTFFSDREGERDTEYQNCMYIAESDTEKLSIPAELQQDDSTEDSVCIRQSSARSPIRRTEVIMIDSVPVKAEVKRHLWNKDAIHESIHMQHRQFIGNRVRREMHHENVNIYQTHPQMLCKENVALSKCIVPDLSRCVPVSPTAPKSGNIQCKAGTREKRFLCTFCGKGFSCPKKVEIHQRVHTGEKPFSCTQCRRRFAQSGNLKRHQRVHTGEKPFSCLQCEKRFSHLHQLKMHQRVHTGERPFICTQCGKRFGEKSYLRIHQQKNHMTAYSVK